MTTFGNGTGDVGDLFGDALFFSIEKGETFSSFGFAVICRGAGDLEDGGKGFGSEDVFSQGVKDSFFEFAARYAGCGAIVFCS